MQNSNFLELFGEQKGQNAHIVEIVTVHTEVPTYVVSQFAVGWYAGNILHLYVNHAGRIEYYSR